MDAFPELYTPRLKLRKIGPDDIPLLVLYANNKKISDYVLNIPHPYTEPDAVFRISYVVQGFRNKSRYVFAIELKERNEFIGEIGLHLDNDGKLAQLGYWIGEPFWNKGFATEAVRAVLKFGYEKIGLEKIFATCHEDNKASARVFLNNRMEHNVLNGNIRQYRMDKEEYLLVQPVNKQI